ncbi:MAG: hypothetical protein EXQ59_03120 [Acidobacteria bacterium]|nr:hypothetical protein [Acidobacteriota bacterium]
MRQQIRHVFRTPSTVLVLALAASFLAFVASTPAWAQAAPPPGPPFTAGWRDGFVVESENGDFRLQLNALLQADLRFAIDDPQNSVINTFAFRRIRPFLQGRVAKHFDFYFNPDFAGAVVNIRDAYVDTRFSSGFRVRVGKGKEPFGLERLQGAAYLTFVERSLPTAVAPDRDVGVKVLGDLGGTLVSYTLGIFNGVADGQAGEGDTNDGKDIVGRVVVRPFPKKPQNPFGGLGLALAASSGTQPATLSSFPTSSRQPFFSYDGVAVGLGVRSRISPQVFYSYKAVWAFAEYIHSVGAVQKAAVSGDITHEAWVLAGSVVLTGESAGDRSVRPRHDFDPGRSTWGALQLAARYHALSVDPNAFTLGFAAAGASRQAKAFTMGANWYLNPYVKWNVNVERTVFDGSPKGVRRAENVILVRQQLSF